MPSETASQRGSLDSRAVNRGVLRTYKKDSVKKVLACKQVLLCPKSGTIVLRYSDLHGKRGTAMSHTCNVAQGLWFDIILCK